VVLATTDNVDCRRKAEGPRETENTLVYVSIGFRTDPIQCRRQNPSRSERYRKRLLCAERVVTYGMRSGMAPRVAGPQADVQFVPFAWMWINGSHGRVAETVDVLSIGNDLMRDFELLVRYAMAIPNGPWNWSWETWAARLENAGEPDDPGGCADREHAQNHCARPGVALP